MHPLSPDQEQRARERAAAMLAESPQAIDASLADCNDRELERYAGYPVRQVSWQALEESERRALRAANLLAKRQQDAQRRAKLEAEAAQHQAANAAELEAYREQARATFKGSPADFDRLWPQLRDEWILDQARAAQQRQAAVLEEKRALMGGSL